MAAAENFMKEGMLLSAFNTVCPFMPPLLLPSIVLLPAGFKIALKSDKVALSEMDNLSVTALSIVLSEIMPLYFSKSFW